MTDQDLIVRLEKRVQTERKLLALIIQDLQEVDRRRLYSELGYRSLYDFTTKHLGYSEYEAFARINAMKIVRELPDVESKIESGQITITHLVHAQRLFNREQFNETQKLEVFEQIAGKSAREAERITLSLSKEPASLKPDRVKQVTEELTELRFLVKQETLAKIEELKGLLAHSHPNASLADLLNHALEQAIENKKASVSRRRRVILAKANHSCENCRSQHALEIDHIHPREGGTDEEENLRVLCRSCNQRAAIHHYGQSKMDHHLS